MYLINIIFLLICISGCLNQNNVNGEETPWSGRWFPDHTTSSPKDKTTNKHGRIPMGVYNPDCDDASNNLSVDWFDNSVNHTCYERKADYVPNYEIRPLYEVEKIPPQYSAAHACMNESIEYDNIIPTFGTHRPLWSKWGEYKFLPKQRWLHNLEHGGVVMLYHPCADSQEVDKLRKLVTSCLYRHVITPYNLLSQEKPLALAAWGARLQMSAVSNGVVVQFIKEAALRGPEHTHKQGQYSYEMINHAKLVSTESDETLCPNL